MIPSVGFDVCVDRLPLSLREPEVFSRDVLNSARPVILIPLRIWDFPWMRLSFHNNPLFAGTCLYTSDWIVRMVGLWKLRRKTGHHAAIISNDQYTDISYLYNLLLSLGKCTVTLLGFEERIAKKFQYLLSRIESGSTLRGCIDPNYMKYRMDDVVLFLKKVSPEVVILSHKVAQKRQFFDKVTQGSVTNAIYLDVHSCVHRQLDVDQYPLWRQLLVFLINILSIPHRGVCLSICFLCCVIMTSCPSGADDGASRA